MGLNKYAIHNLQTGKKVNDANYKLKDFPASVVRQNINVCKLKSVWKKKKIGRHLCARKNVQTLH